MATATMNPATFREEHPEFCDAAKIRIPGVGALPPTEGATRFDGELTLPLAAVKDANTLPNMLKHGPEACGFYVSFRLSPSWGVYVRRPALVALKDEYQRIILRDLKGYMNPGPGATGASIAELLDRMYYSLALDFLVAHMRFHYTVDVAASQLELADGVPRYAPYQETYWAEFANPPKDPRAIGNLEECLANFEAFRSFMNPNYTDAIAKLVEGSLEERNAQEWKAFFIGGRWAVEIATTLSRQPPGYRDVTKLCTRRTSVGSTNYVRVMYLPDPDARDQRAKELSKRLSGRDVDKTVLPEALPDPPIYFL
jgi:hypothetical protein